jgi:uroporphyrinogen decarboxylase
MQTTADSAESPRLEVTPLSSRQRFLQACACRPVDRPPVWLMRQAGRALPEYRALRKKHSFLELVQNPELAAEITLQPIRRFGFDAAILFSDILATPEGLGQKYRFDEQSGLRMDFAVQSAADLARLDVEDLPERLAYVLSTLRFVKSALASRTALIGFAGSPWTLATFMAEGGAAEKYTRALTLFHKDRKTYTALAEKLTAAVVAHLRMQIEAGVDAVQIFDSHGCLLAPTDFQEASGRWIRQIISELRASNPELPVIVFSLGTHGNWDDLLATGASVLGIDWRFPLADARRLLPSKVGLQGNFAPELLCDTAPEAVAAETSRLLEIMRGRPGYIFNLGHGVPPEAKLENIKALVETVRNFK